MKKIFMMATLLGISATAFTACPASNNYTQNQPNSLTQPYSTRTYGTNEEMRGQGYGYQSTQPYGVRPNVNREQGYGYQSAQPNDSRTFNRSEDRSSFFGYGDKRDTRDSQVMDDASLTRSIQSNISNPNVSVTVKDGVVTLKGTVGSEDESDKLEDRIEDMKGVKSVDNQLKVSSTPSTSYQYNR